MLSIFGWEMKELSRQVRYFLIFSKFNEIFKIYFHFCYTIVHKDPYENIYCVISGEKEFIIHPPTDLPWIPYKKYPTAIYKEVEPGKWITEPINSSVKDNSAENSKYDASKENNTDSLSWIAVDPLHPDYEK